MTWEQVTLDSLLDFSIGGVWGGMPGEQEVDVRVWRVTELKPGGRVEPATAARRSVTRKQFVSRALEAGDLLLEKSGGGPKTPVGRVGLVRAVPESAICANFMQLLRPNRAQVEPRYLHLYLNYFHDTGGTEAMQNASTNIRNIKASDYVKVAIPLPSLAEQHRIVTILEDHLSRLDAADSYLSAALRRLTALQERLIGRAVTGTDFDAGVATELPAVGTDDGLLPALPADWNWARLGDVADVVGGVTKDAKKQNDPNFIEVPYLRVANVQRGHLNLDTVTTIRVPPAKAEALRLRRGDVLLNEGGDRDKLARGWVWDGQIDDCIHQNHVFRARITDPRLTPEFLSFTANSFGGPWAERNGKQSVNLASISLKVIRQMPVIVPARGEAEAAVSRLTEQLAGTARLRAGIDAARARCTAFRRSLLGAAFSGRLTGSSKELSVVEGRIEA